MKKLIAAILISISGSSHAAWQGYSQVKGIVFENEEDGSRVYVSMTVTTNPSDDSCEYGGEWKRIYGNTAKGKHLIASVLVAYVAKQRIQLNFSGCDDWGRNVVTGIMVHD
jgi:hypothetical protein